jgi:DNA-binding XRE family transcriptional regulator
MRGPTTLYLLPRLAELRKAQFMTQSDLATKAGLSKTAITALETGKRAKPETVKKLAEALGISREELVK